jgi:hypothetical protein
MGNKNTKKSATAVGVIIGALVATAMIILGIVLIIISRQYKRTTATVISSDCTKGKCTTHVSYDVRGKKYKGSIKSDTSSKTGNKITIQYKISNPDQIRSKQPLIELPLGIVLLVIGVIIWILLAVYYRHPFKSPVIFIF